MMETRLRKSVAASPRVKSVKPEKSPSPVRSLRSSLRSRNRPPDVGKDSPVKNVATRTPRTRRVSDVSCDASPSRVTRLRKSILPQEILSGSGETPEVPKPRSKKVGNLITPSRKVPVESSVKQSDSSEADLETPTKSSSQLSSRSRSSSDVKQVGKTSVNSPKSGDLSPVKIPSLGQSQNSPKRAASSPRRASKNSSDIAEDRPGELVQKISTESPEKPGSPRTRRSSVIGPDVAKEVRINLTPIEEANKSVVSSGRKSSESPGSPRGRQSPRKNFEGCSKLIINEPSPEESTEVSSDKRPSRRSPEKSTPGSPKNCRKLEKSLLNAEANKSVVSSGRKSTESIGSPRGRQSPSKTFDGGTKLIINEAPPEKSKEPDVSSEKRTSRSSPEKTTPGSSKSRRKSEKSLLNADSFSDLTLQLTSEDESNATPISLTKTDKSRKLLDSSKPSSPRTRSRGESSAKDVAVVTPDESVVVTVSENDGDKKTPGKAPGTPTSGNTPKLSLNKSKSEFLMEVDLPSIECGRSPATPAASRLSENSSDHISGIVVSNENVGGSIPSTTPRRKSLETPKQCTISEKRDEKDFSSGLSRPSLNGTEDALGNSSEKKKKKKKKKDRSRKSHDESSPSTPRNRTLSTTNEMDVSFQGDDYKRKSLDKPSPSNPRAQSPLKKLHEEESSGKDVMVVSSDESVIFSSPKKNDGDKKTRGQATGTPRGVNTSKKSLDDINSELLMEVDSDSSITNRSPATPMASRLVENSSGIVVSSDENVVGKIPSTAPQRKSWEIPKQKILEKLDVKEASNGLSRPPLNGIEDAPGNSLKKKKKKKKKAKRRKSLENPSLTTLRTRNPSTSNELEVSFKEKDSLNQKVTGWQAAKSLVSVSTESKSSRYKKKKQKKALLRRESPERPDGGKTNEETKAEDSEVTVRRRGGGSIIESRPVFSDDAKYVYLNCGWGVRVFSVETGECVRVFDALSKVVTCFCWDSLPAALTSEGVFIAWDPRSGKIQHKVRMTVKATEIVVDGFFITCSESTSHLCLVVESKDFTNLRMYSGSNFKSVLSHPLNARMVCHPYKLHCLSVGGDVKMPFIAYIDAKKEIRVVNLQNKCFFRNSCPTDKYWTCIRAHPTEDAIAVGDSIGRIMVFRNLKSSHPGNTRSINSVYHWHTLPVGEIAFTPAASAMYSGGGELTLVKWNLENPHVRNFLPRLSADIVHISISSYNQMIAVATADNGVQIVTPSNKLQCVLQQLSWSVIATEQERMFPSGLVYDPRSRGLILNSRPGHLQLYSTHSETLTFNIDVTMMNYLTQERNKVIVNTQVTHSALTSDGVWLATVETRYEPGQTLELRLKFWVHSNKKKKFILATVIDMPHDGQVHTIKFSPEPSRRSTSESLKSDLDVVLVSTGADRKMRLWSKTPHDSLYVKGETWRCQNACFYRDQPCGPCSFSFDGSLLAVGFGAALTLWDVENVVLKQSLSRGTETIKFVEFGHTDCCSKLMCATETSVVAWDLLKLVVSWKVDVKSAIFIADPYSSFVAVFTVNNQWKILNAHNGEVVFTMNSEGKSEMSDWPQKQQVLAAVFTPRHRPNPEAPKWMRNSYLYYIDVYQELNCLEPANEITQLPKFQLAADKESGTLFGSLVGAKTVRELADEKNAAAAVGYGVLGVKAITELLRPSAHSLPPVRVLCGSLLQSFVIIKSDGLEVDRDDKSEDDKTTIIASSDSEDEVGMPTFAVPKSRPKKTAPSTKPDRKPPTEPMETDDVDLRKHFPILDEDDDTPWRPLNRETDPSELFVIEE